MERALALCALDRVFRLAHRIGTLDAAPMAHPIADVAQPPIALKLGRAGAKVLVNDFDAEPAKATVEIIRESGGEADVFIGDVREDNFGDRFIQHAVATCRSVDIIINNAGYTRDAVIQKMSVAEWREILMFT